MGDAVTLYIIGLLLGLNAAHAEQNAQCRSVETAKSHHLYAKFNIAGPLEIQNVTIGYIDPSTSKMVELASAADVQGVQSTTVNNDTAQKLVRYVIAGHEGGVDRLYLPQNASGNFSAILRHQFDKDDRPFTDKMDCSAQ